MYVCLYVCWIYDDDDDDDDDDVRWLFGAGLECSIQGYQDSSPH